LSIVAMASMPFAAQASLITGVLNISGTVTISEGNIVFDPNSPAENFAIAASTGGFAALNAPGLTGSVENITNPPDSTGVALDVPDFLTFAAAPNITITLTFLAPGLDGSAGCADAAPTTNAQAIMQLCTPSVPSESPYNLQNLTTTSSSASFTVDGVEMDSLTGTSIGIVGTFTQPFTTMIYQQLELDVENGIPVTTPFSAQFATVAATPEPSTLLEFVMGIGLVGLSIVYRKKLKKA